MKNIMDHSTADTLSPTRRQVYRAARAYRKSGLSFIPIRADGTKMPAFELLPREWDAQAGKYRRPWGGYRARRPTPAEVRGWFWDSVGKYGMAVLGGAVSGNLEIIDLDNWGVVEPWMKLVEQKAPGLLEKLVRVKTPRPGMHVYYRCPVIEGNQKLARIPDPERDNEKPKTIIEVKGEGGYCLAPPSPAACHKSGRCYAFVGGKDLTAIPTITPEERQILLDCGRALNRWDGPKRQPYVPRPRADAGGRLDRPGDDFNRKADWGDILQPYGWAYVGKGGGGADLWCRPGKKGGTSATTNYEGSDLLRVFSSNADPFEEDTSYTKFHAYALLEHDGDISSAAQALRKQGYGREKSNRRKVRNLKKPFARYATYGVRLKKRPR
jgi:putative DNA primase/helicase